MQLTTFQKRIPKSSDVVCKEAGTSSGGRVDGCGPTVPIDLQTGEPNRFSEVDNAGIFHPPDVNPF